MLTKAGCEQRRTNLWEAVGEGIDWLLIADPRHVHYLSNFWVNPLSFSGGERALLLLERDRGATLLGDNFTLRSGAGEAHVDDEVVETWYDHKHAVENRDEVLFRAVRSVAGRLDGSPGVVESQWLPLGAWTAVAGGGQMQLADAGDSASTESDAYNIGRMLRQLRRQKLPDEIALLKECMQAGNAGQARAREVVKAGISELDVYRKVQSAAIGAAGRPGLVYGDFRALNAQAPKQGGLPTSYVLQDGDLFLLDYSVVLAGYRSDFTNTIAVGTPTDDQAELFEFCQQALQAGAESLKAGVAASDVYAAVSRPLEDAGYGALPHHAGHGIGLAHPEPPILVPDSSDVLLAGDVVTIEPGLYIEGKGGMRIEHNYLITETGAEQLSGHVIALA